MCSFRVIEKRLLRYPQANVSTYPAVGTEPGYRHIEDKLGPFFNCEPEIDEPVCKASWCTVYRGTRGGERSGVNKASCDIVDE